MKVNYVTKAREINLFQIIQVDNVDKEVKSKELSPSDKICVGEFCVSFVSASEESSEIKLKMNNGYTGQEETFDFSMKYWPSFIKFDGGDQNSGDYIFRPIKGLYHSLDYSKFHKATFNSEQMDFYF